MLKRNAYQKLAEAINVKDSELVPRLFKLMCNEVEAKLLLAASPPKTSEQLCSEIGLLPSEVSDLIEGLFKKGLIFKSKKPDGTRYYRVRSLHQLHDATAVWVDAPAELLDLWKEHTEKELPYHLMATKKVLSPSFTRVIPIGKHISPQSQVLAYDDVKYIVEEARSLAVTICSCRRIDGKCGKPLETCIQVDKAADYAVERGSGRSLSKKEALEILEMAEKEGLVHVSDNKTSDFRVICNCCSDCCFFWSSVKTKHLQIVAPSRFCPDLDQETCVACEACIEACPFDAIDLSANLREKVKINDDLCMGCGVCSSICPEGAILMNEVRSPDFIHKTN